VHVIYLYVVCIVLLQVRAGHTEEQYSSATCMRRAVSYLYQLYFYCCHVVCVDEVHQ